MCRTVESVASTFICGIQMLVRTFITLLFMLENVARSLMQTVFNLISFVLQFVSIIPLCVIFLLTTRLKCFMCGGFGPFPNRGGCDCLMSIFAITILFLIFRATGVLDKIFHAVGYAKATTHIARFVPAPGEITECSRNDTDTEYIFYPMETTTNDYEEDTTTETTVKEFSTTFDVIRFIRLSTIAETFSDSDNNTKTVSSTVPSTLTTSYSPTDESPSSRILRLGLQKLTDQVYKMHEFEEYYPLS